MQPMSNESNTPTDKVAMTLPLRSRLCNPCSEANTLCGKVDMILPSRYMVCNSYSESDTPFQNYITTEVQVMQFHIPEGCYHVLFAHEKSVFSLKILLFCVMQCVMIINGNCYAHCNVSIFIFANFFFFFFLVGGNFCRTYS